MTTTQSLYSPEVLALATDLSRFPSRSDLPLHGTARSATCGSVVTLDISLTEKGKIAELGIAAHACAIGQAAATVFARGAIGRDGDELAQALTAMQRWLTKDNAMPSWPGLATIAPARGFPGRHGAVLLPWKAALAALSTDGAPS